MYPHLSDALRNDFQRYPTLSTAQVALEKILQNADFVPSAARKTFEELRKAAQDLPQAQEYLVQVEEIILERERQIKSQIGRHIHEALQAEGLSLHGQYPNFNCSFFSLELLIAKDKAIIWYGPEQEKVAQVKHDAKAIVDALLKARKDLEHPWAEDEFLAQLRSSYKALLAQVGLADHLPIIDVLAQMAFDLSKKDKRFREDPSPKFFAKYGRKNFSYDLYRTREQQAYKLKVATRLETRHRSGYLWIPSTSNESTEGTTFASISIEV